MKSTSKIQCLVFALLVTAGCKQEDPKQEIHTVVSIQGQKFFINGRPTYEGRIWNDRPVEGLLFNARMVQGIFDDLNDATHGNWIYPDTKKWDPDRNTDEFVAAMPLWKAHGLLAFTVNLQGGSPMGYGNQNWINSAYFEDGQLRPAYMTRLQKILDEASRLGMVPIVGLFYFGQDQVLLDESAVIAAVDNVVGWLLDHDYCHVLIEIDNECDIPAYDHDILKSGRVHELIEHVKRIQKNGFRYLVGVSYKGNAIPDTQVVKASDFILLHGNGVGDPKRISEMVREVRELPGYRPMPILFNEDDHYNFDKPVNNMIEAVRSYASWGFFDFRRRGEAFEEGYQCPPVDWSIHSERKKGFFNLVKEITGY